MTAIAFRPRTSAPPRSSFPTGADPAPEAVADLHAFLDEGLPPGARRAPRAQPRAGGAAATSGSPPCPVVPRAVTATLAAAHRHRRRAARRGRPRSERLPRAAVHALPQQRACPTSSSCRRRVAEVEATLALGARDGHAGHHPRRRVHRARRRGALRRRPHARPLAARPRRRGRRRQRLRRGRRGAHARHPPAPRRARTGAARVLVQPGRHVRRLVRHRRPRPQRLRPPPRRRHRARRRRGAAVRRAGALSRRRAPRRARRGRPRRAIARCRRTRPKPGSAAATSSPSASPTSPAARACSAWSCSSCSAWASGPTSAPSCSSSATRRDAFAAAERIMRRGRAHAAAPGQPQARARLASHGICARSGPRRTPRAGGACRRSLSRAGGCRGRASTGRRELRTPRRSLAASAASDAAAAYLYVDFLGIRAARAFATTHRPTCPGGRWRSTTESVRFAAERFRPQQNKRFGPGMLAAEVTLPAASCRSICAAAYRLARRAGVELDPEVYYVGDGEALVIAGYLTDHRAAGVLSRPRAGAGAARPRRAALRRQAVRPRPLAGLVRRRPLRPGRTAAPRGAQGRPRPAGPRQSRRRARHGPARAARARSGSRLPAGRRRSLRAMWTHARPGAAGPRRAVDVLAQAPRARARGAARRPERPPPPRRPARAIHCVNCGECNSVCPVYDVVGHPPAPDAHPSRRAAVCRARRRRAAPPRCSTCACAAATARRSARRASRISSCTRDGRAADEAASRRARAPRAGAGLVRGAARYRDELPATCDRACTCAARRRRCPAPCAFACCAPRTTPARRPRACTAPPACPRAPPAPTASSATPTPRLVTTDDYSLHRLRRLRRGLPGQQEERRADAARGRGADGGRAGGDRRVRGGGGAVTRLSNELAAMAGGSGRRRRRPRPPATAASPQWEDLLAYIVDPDSPLVREPRAHRRAAARTCSAAPALDETEFWGLERARRGQLFLSAFAGQSRALPELELTAFDIDKLLKERFRREPLTVGSAWHHGYWRSYFSHAAITHPANDGLREEFSTAWDIVRKQPAVVFRDGGGRRLETLRAIRLDMPLIVGPIPFGAGPEMELAYLRRHRPGRPGARHQARARWSSSRPTRPRRTPQRCCRTPPTSWCASRRGTPPRRRRARGRRARRSCCAPPASSSSIRGTDGRQSGPTPRTRGRAPSRQLAAAVARPSNPDLLLAACTCATTATPSGRASKRRRAATASRSSTTTPAALKSYRLTPRSTPSSSRSCCAPACSCVCAGGDTDTQASAASVYESVLLGANGGAMTHAAAIALAPEVVDVLAGGDRERWWRTRSPRADPERLREMASARSPAGSTASSSSSAAWASTTCRRPRATRWRSP